MERKDDKCGFCVRKMKTPLVRAGGVGFCCTSCFRAYQALYPPTARKRETGKLKTRKKKAKTRNVNRKQKKHG